MTGHPQQSPPFAQPPAKKGMNGCLIAVLALLGVGIVSAAGVSLYLYFEFREYLAATAEMGELMVDAQKAPGAADLKALGCEEVAVLDLAKFGKVLERFERESARREGRPPKPSPGTSGFMLTCKVTLKTAPSCADVARAFIKSQKPSASVVASVSTALGSSCQEEFDASGAPVGSPPGSPPSLPSP